MLCSPLPSENYCNDYFFNGIDLVNQKTQYVLDNGYGGVMVWNLGQDTNDKTSLLSAINEVILNESGTGFVIDSDIPNVSETLWIDFASLVNLIK